MTKEERELLLRDLCARVPYKTRVSYTYAFAGVVGNNEYTVKGILSYGKLQEFSLPNIGCEKHWVTCILPYLRPMSSMTEEEKKMMRSYGFELILYDTGCTGFANIENYIDEISFRFMEEFLNAHYFDYRGLIPMGLALEAPEDMYNLN